LNLGYIIKLSDLNMKKILLVGSSGFLGKNVFNQINKENEIYSISGKDDCDVSDIVSLKLCF
jgi:dTDP-4-dehydrorhamnose reductase